MVARPKEVAEMAHRWTTGGRSSNGRDHFVRKPDQRLGSTSKTLVTYGKSTKPLSLTGKRFLGRSNYDISSDDEEEPNDGAGASVGAADTDDDTSSVEPHLSATEPRLSEDGWEVSNVAKASRRTDKLESAPVGGPSRAVRTLIRSKEDTAKTASKSRSTPVCVPQPEGQPLPTEDKRKRADKRTRTARRAPGVCEMKTPMRVLPMNELYLVASASQQGDYAEPHSSAPSISTQDPIRASSSMPHRGSVPFMAGDEGVGGKTSKTPLSAIRKRLKTPNLTHKTFKRRRSVKTFFFDTPAPKPITGDGFEATERCIDYRIMPRKQRRRKARSTIRYTMLQLARGPLPDVAFECSTDELQIEPSGGPHHASRPREDEGTQSGARTVRRIEQPQWVDKLRVEEPAGKHDESYHMVRSKHKSSLPRPSDQARRQVSFSDREHLIIAQLSSISAPERRHTNSDDDDEESEDDEDDEDVGRDEEESGEDIAGCKASGVVDQQLSDDQDDDSVLSLDELASDTVAHTSSCQIIQETETQLGGRAPVNAIDDGTSNRGVTLDFRRPLMSGSMPKRTLGRRHLMEIHEAISEVVDQDIVEVPRSELAYVHASNHNRGLEVGSNRALHRQPRSILKTSTPLVPDSTYRPEDTAANTRRNSMVEVKESRYFTQAMEILRSPAAPVKHTVIPRRTSGYFHHHQSDYFEDDHVHVADSEAIVPETSPQPAKYADTSQLKVLRRDSETMWTSQSLPTATAASPKDLRTLTRTVSREHGTISQTVRGSRRPSLPFRSPSIVIR